jgi:hypothetical protein
MRTMTFIMGKRCLVLLAVFAISGAPPTAIADSARLSPTDAINHVDQMATVCGHVASAKYATSANRQPTFLNLAKPYPNHVFTAVIWGSDRVAFPYAPESSADGRICVAGTIQGIPGKSGDNCLGIR